MDCPRCDAAVADGARYCTSCGSQLPGDPDGTRSMPAVQVQGAAPDEQASTDEPAPGDEQAPAAVAARPGQDGQLRTCPACGADNSASRMLCARCGVDLDSGERPVATPVVHQPGPATDVSGDVSPLDDGRGARTAWIVAAIVVIGSLVGVLVGLQLAQRGRTPEVSAPSFDPAVYPGEPEVLAVTGVGASSTRPASGDVTYEASNLVDDDITTAWSHDPSVEAAADVDLALRLAEPSWVTALTFANGAQSDELAFPADGRVLAMRLLANGDAAAELRLLDEPGLQRVELPDPVLVDTIRLVVLEAVEGETYEEVSISEIVVTGHPAVGEDLRRMLADEPTADESTSDEPTADEST